MAKGNTSKGTALAQSEDAVIAKERAAARGKKVEKELLFSKTNYIIIGVGLVMVIMGFFLMSGGHNEPDEWNPDVIYSFMRITIAPLVILGGLGVVIFAIFKSSDDEAQNLGA
ncbi:MAG: uncharacterized membrane protein YuzA (DUF378 family) [Aureispira sp.]|jgi:uncharacterized membrane protein YuzA (DUF378 family)